MNHFSFFFLIFDRFIPLLCRQAVLSVHDTVAQKNFDPVLPPLPDDFEDELDEESVKIVRLVKNKEPLVSLKAAGGRKRSGDSSR